MIHALNYAADGFFVFPCRPGDKQPLGSLVPNGCLDATTDAETIKRWWTKCPNANIGIATGSKNGLAVVDLDGPDGALSGRKLSLYSSVTSLTGNGSQLFYADPTGKMANSVKKFAPGIDTRGEGGYVVVAPSLHPNGKRYAWRSIPLSRAALPPLPQVFQASIVGTRTVVSKPEGWIAEALGGMKIGNIDNTLVSVLGRLRRDGYSEADAEILIRPHAERAGATSGHLEEKIRHIWRTYQAATQVSSVSTKSEAIDAFLEDQAEVEWICKPIIAKKSIGFVAGLPETCKTWLMVDLAVESARVSGSWLGLFGLQQQKVLFIDQERFRGETQRRFNAVIAGKGITRSALKDTLFLKCGTTIKLDLEASYQAFRSELTELRPDLVIVDSFATFHGSPENDRMAIQNVLNRIKQLRDEVGCTFIFINHESKMTFQHVEENKTPNAFDMLGSVGIVAAAEFCLTVRKIEPGLSMCHHTKSTLATASKSFTVQLVDLPDGGIVVKGTL